MGEQGGDEDATQPWEPPSSEDPTGVRGSDRWEPAVDWLQVPSQFPLDDATNPDAAAAVTEDAPGRRWPTMWAGLSNGALWASAIAVTAVGVTIVSVYLATVREAAPSKEVPEVSTRLYTAIEELEEAGFDPVPVRQVEQGFPTDRWDVTSLSPEPGVRAEVGSEVLVFFTSADLGNSWGPQRDTKSCEPSCVGFDYPVFNSLIETPVYGDERNFVTGRLAVTEVDVAASHDNEIEALPGDRVQVRLYLNNGGREPDGDMGETHRAEGVRVGLDPQTDFYAEGSAAVIGWVSASNTKPEQVWDSVRILLPERSKIRYVRGSAVLHRLGTGTQPSGDGAKRKRLSDDIITQDGVEVTSAPEVAGEWWSSYGYVGWVTAEFEVIAYTGT